MIRFVLGFLSVGVALLLTAVLMDWSFLSQDRDECLQLLKHLVFLPGVVAWAAAEVIQFVRPRRVFDRRVRSGARPFLLGVASGLLWAGLLAAALLAIDAWASDFVLTMAAALVASVAVVLFTARAKPHECVVCGYDLASTPGRCPECGGVGTRTATTRPARPATAAQSASDAPAQTQPSSP